MEKKETHTHTLLSFWEESSTLGKKTTHTHTATQQPSTTWKKRNTHTHTHTLIVLGAIQHLGKKKHTHTATQHNLKKKETHTRIHTHTNVKKPHRGGWRGRARPRRCRSKRSAPPLSAPAPISGLFGVVILYIYCCGWLVLGCFVGWCLLGGWVVLGWVGGGGGCGYV